MASDHFNSFAYVTRKGVRLIQVGGLLAVFISFHEGQSFANDQKSFKMNLNIVSMFPTDQTLIKVHVIKPPTILDNPPGIIEVNSMYSRI